MDLDEKGPVLYLSQLIGSVRRAPPTRPFAKLRRVEQDVERPIFEASGERCPRLQRHAPMFLARNLKQVGWYILFICVHATAAKDYRPDDELYVLHAARWPSLALTFMLAFAPAHAHAHARASHRISLTSSFLVPG